VVGTKQSIYEKEVEYLQRVSSILFILGLAGFLLFFFHSWFSVTCITDPSGNLTGQTFSPSAFEFASGYWYVVIAWGAFLTVSPGFAVSWIWVSAAGIFLIMFIGFLGLFAGDTKPTAVIFGAIEAILGSLIVSGVLGAISQVYLLSASPTGTGYRFSFTAGAFPFMELGIGALITVIGVYSVFGPTITVEPIRHIPGPRE
jgi:hypothetical protein